jgi:hypothetical protein
MGEYLGLNAVQQWSDNQTSVPEPEPVAPPKHTSLVPCSDCGHQVSHYAESCPSCGRYFRSYNRRLEVTPGAGWPDKIAWGIVLSSILWIFIFGVLFVLALVFFGGLSQALRR